MNATIKLLLATTLGALILSSCQGGETPRVPEDKRMELANAYYTNGLYEAAVAEYLDYLDQYDVGKKRRANTYFNVANIYFERLNDYEKALTYYFKIKYLYPESSVQGEVGKRIVSCLERLGRSADASRKMEETAALRQSRQDKEEDRPGAVLAEIGSTKITEGDLQYEIRKLPAYMQEQLNSKNRKKEILNQYILQELLYETAKRMGLDEHEDVIEGTFRAKKALMAETYLQKEMQDKVKITPEDVELYYLAHKDKYTEKDEEGDVVRQKSLQEVRQQVASDLKRERQQKAYQKLLNRLMQANDVNIYEHRIR